MSCKCSSAPDQLNSLCLFLFKVEGWAYAPLVPRETDQVTSAAPNHCTGAPFRNGGVLQPPVPTESHSLCGVWLGSQYQPWAGEWGEAGGDVSAGNVCVVGQE